jgi:Fe2+ transport system protein FeoA
MTTPIMMPQTITLYDLRPGEQAVIAAALDDTDMLNTVRMGLIPGQHIRLQSRIPGGPFVIQQGQVELAIGRDLARRIQVTLLPGNVTP